MLFFKQIIIRLVEIYIEINAVPKTLLFTKMYYRIFDSKNVKKKNAIL